MTGRTPEAPDLDADAALVPAPASVLIDHAALELVGLSEPSPGPARDVSLSMCRITGASVVGSTLPGLRAIDSEFLRADCSGASWVDARLVRCVFESCKCTGLDTRGGTLRDLRFHECKMSDAFIQESTLDRVWFESCQLQGLDLSGSTLDRVTIRDCNARNLRLLGARIDALDLRGSRIEGVALDAQSVSKIIIDPLQTPALANALGARVLKTHDPM